MSPLGLAADAVDREARLLVAFARRDLAGPPLDAAVEILAHGLDWTVVLALAQRHGLMPLVDRHLAALSEVDVPARVRAAVWAHADATRRRNATMAEELGRIVRHLQASGISSIPYKGPTLAVQAYQDLALREFGDLDLLVPRAEVQRAKAALEAIGYSMQHPLQPAQLAALLASPRFYELPLVHPARGLMVELHWRSDPDVEVLPLCDDAWWHSRPRIVVAGHEMAALQGEELLTVLCLHGGKHFWSSLGWLVDVAELVRRNPDLDFDQVARKGRSAGARRRMALGLALARELLDAPIPFDAIDGEVDLGIRASIEDELFALDPTPRSVVRAISMMLRLQDRASQRFTCAWHLAMTPGWGEWMRWRLPAALSFLYLPLRIARLTVKYGKAVFIRSPRTPAAATPRTPPPRPHSTG